MLVQKDVQNLLEPVIYRRAQLYQADQRVMELEYDPAQGLLQAWVGGSRHTPYRVTIRLNHHQDFQRASCDCPYDYGYCKHVGAVLLEWLASRTGATVVPLAPMDQLVGSRLALEYDAAGKRANAYLKLLDRILCPKKVKKSTKDRYRLVFVVERYLEYSCGLGRDSCRVRPALQYIRKNGSPGRFEKFRAEKLTEEVSTGEQLLLERLVHPHGDLSLFREQAAFLHAHPRVPLFFEEGAEYRPLERHSFDLLVLDFTVFSIDVHSRAVRFACELLPHEGSQEVGRLSAAAVLCHDTGSLYAVCPESGLFLRGAGVADIAPLLVDLLGNHSLYSAADIQLLRERFAPWADRLEFRSTVRELVLEKGVPLPGVYLRDNFGEVSGELFFQYEDCTVRPFADAAFTPGACEDGIQKIVFFDKQQEQTWRNRLQALVGAQLEPYRYEDALVFNSDLDLRGFLVQYGPPLLDAGFVLHKAGVRWPLVSKAGKIVIHTVSGIDWFELSLSSEDEQGTRLPFKLQRDLLDAGLIEVNGGLRLLGEKERRKLRLLLDCCGGDSLRLSRLQADCLAAVEENLEDPNQPGLRTALDIARALTGKKEIKHVPKPEGFQGTLRPYQQAGLDWLVFLHEHQLGGCLADDMGLGKTVQALALFQYLLESGSGGPFLVVAPVSTLSNWYNEAARFTPGLGVLIHAGPDRCKEPQVLANADLILVSYHTLRNDKELFQELKPGLMLLDESQNIKNVRTATFKAVRSIPAASRFSLTGTPVENNSMELWAQMDFLNPGLLENQSRFKRLFATPIESRGDKEVAERLRRRVYPFILRRRKQDVAADLPPREEVVVYCEMEERQQALYQRVKSEIRARILNAMGSGDPAKFLILILKGLLRLRQMALLPKLVDPAFVKAGSVKLDVLKDLVLEILAEGHKLLLFSQFVSILKVLETWLNQEQLAYAYLDGQSKDRAQQIKTFQKPDGPNIFLLSLKAGGTGINLTAADYVILFDPWWNPAVEAQAIDRCHRIGQTRRVIAYRLIVKETIEEKIMDLQQKKRLLVDQLITSEKSFFKQLDKEEIMGLFD